MRPELRRRVRSVLEAFRARREYDAARRALHRAPPAPAPPREPEAIVRGFFGVGNLGDELLLGVLRRAFEARGLRLVAASLDAERTRREHGIDAIPRTASPRDAVELLPRLRRCRLLVLGPGGILQSYGAPSGSLLAYALHAEAAALCGTPLALLGVGAGPLPRESRRVARGILARARVALLRDEDSRALVAPDRNEAGGVWVAPDLAFLLDLTPEAPVAPAAAASSMDVGLAPIRLRNAAPEFAPADPERCRAELARGLAGHLPPGARVRPATWHETEDAQELALLERHLRAAGVPVAATAPATLPAMRDWLAGCGVVVVTRFHALLLAILAGRPAVVLAYHPKVDALARAAGLEEWTIPLGRLTAGRLTETLIGASAKAAGIEERMARFTQACRREAGAALEAALDRLLAEGPR